MTTQIFWQRHARCVVSLHGYKYFRKDLNSAGNDYLFIEVDGLIVFKIWQYKNLVIAGNCLVTYELVIGFFPIRWVGSMISLHKIYLYIGIRVIPLTYLFSHRLSESINTTNFEFVIF